jgi:hypothetical protein
MPVVIGVFAAAPGLAQVPAGNTSPQAPAPPPGGLLRKSPPQPQQKQSLDYFVGRWNVTWSGRESAFSPGPRTGTVTYTRLGTSNFLDVRGEGKFEAAGAYKEAGTLGWHEGQKILALHERLPGGVEMLSLGDWTSPITIRFESAPIPATAAKGAASQMLTLRRIYMIVSAQAFTVTEELSVDGKPFERLGRGVFGKAEAVQKKN